MGALATVDVISVSFGLDTAVCQDDASGSASVTFVTQHGDVPLLGVDTSNLVDDANGGVRVFGLFFLSRFRLGTGWWSCECFTLRKSNETQ